MLKRMSHTSTGTSTRATWLCLAAAGLASAPGTSATSEEVVPLLRHEAGGGAIRAPRALRQHEHEQTVLGLFDGPTAGEGGGNGGGTAEQIGQIQQITKEFALGEERGHLKDPDLLDGDNPGW